VDVLVGHALPDMGVQLGRVTLLLGRNLANEYFVGPLNLSEYQIKKTVN